MTMLPNMKFWSYPYICIWDCIYEKIKNITNYFKVDEIRTSFRVMKMTRTVFENKSGDQYTKDSV